MKDADLLDLLEIIEKLAHAGYLAAPENSTAEGEYRLAEHMCQSFRSAIRQRMIHSQENV
jgi:hypothetical protein